MARQYKNPPIREALIDIQVDLPNSFELGLLEDLGKLWQSEYPLSQRQVQFEGQFTAGEKLTTITQQRDLGFSFSSQDKKRVVQARLNGFTFSQLSPYNNWDSLRAEAARLWHSYRSLTQDHPLSRVAVRYINQIDLPAEGPILDYKDYFKTTPEISDDLPQMLAKFMMKLALPIQEIGGALILTQASVDPPSPGMVSVVLDIDVFSLERKYFSDDASMWSLLDRMRDKKNEYFEGSIKDKTRSLFGGEL